MSDSEMADLANRLNGIEVPLTAQSKAKRKRHNEDTSLISTCTTNLAEQLRDFDIASATHSGAKKRKRHNSNTEETCRKRQHALMDDLTIPDTRIDLAPDRERSTTARETKLLDWNLPPSEHEEPFQSMYPEVIALQELEEARAAWLAKEAKKRNYG
ncbi:hypothetical protein J4E91_004963 [Alternaria rosae]|nr:hypothetical protein J4E91_004963 [Alternaria rosae]